MNVKPTCEVIRQAAAELREAAKRLDREAVNLEESKNFEDVASVVNVLTNLFNNLRMDLLVARPVRELIHQNINLCEDREKD